MLAIDHRMSRSAQRPVVLCVIDTSWNSDCHERSQGYDYNDENDLSVRDDCVHRHFEHLGEERRN